MIKGFHSKKACFHSRFSALSYWSYLLFIEAIRVLAQQMSLSTEFHGTLCSISQRWYVHHRSSEREQNQRWRDHSDWLFFTNRRIITIVLCYSRRLICYMFGLMLQRSSAVNIYTYIFLQSSCIGAHCCHWYCQSVAVLRRLVCCVLCAGLTGQP